MFLKLSNSINKFYLLCQAGKLEDLLSSMNLSKDIVDYISNLPDSHKGLVLSQIKKNPILTLDQIKLIPAPEESKPLPKEELKTNHLPNNLKTWALLTLKKLRNKPLYNNLLEKLDEIKDWYDEEKPDISGYTAQQAIQTSDQWHKDMAAAGAGKVYTEGTKFIVYGPTWKYPPWNGWTIREIKSGNDLLVEGNKMDHCVGSYADEVANGEIKVYSLRDPSNQPHVTAGAKNNVFFQLQGAGNSDPKQEYKRMLGEWFKTLSGAKISNEGFSYNVEQKDISGIFGSDYGLSVDIRPKELEDIINESYKYLLENNASNSTIKNHVETITQEAINHDEQILLSGQEFLKYYNSFIREIINFLNNDADYEEASDFWYGNNSHYFFKEFEKENPYPKEENFESRQEYIKALEEWEKLQYETEDEAFNYWYNESAGAKFRYMLRNEVIESLKHTQLLKDHPVITKASF